MERKARERKKKRKVYFRMIRLKIWLNSSNTSVISLRSQ